uniref:DNA-binding protein Ewg n=1 Tax=Lygus hesperus TaxID=30085 RepID=A0A0A9XAI2_LYGHE
MTQAQLREFIPIMLRYSTGRGKPGWGKECMRPIWWPEDIPWSNIRVDSRNWESKTVESWSSTLRRIIIACYKYHGREDLLNEAAVECGVSRSIAPMDDSSGEDRKISPGTQISLGNPPLEKVVHEDGTISLYVPKPADTRHVILTDADGQEYCVQISVPNNTAAVLGNFQMTTTDAHNVQQIGVSQGHFVSLNN